MAAQERLNTSDAVSEGFEGAGEGGGSGFSGVCILRPIKQCAREPRMQTEPEENLDSWFSIGHRLNEDFERAVTPHTTYRTKQSQSS